MESSTLVRSNNLCQINLLPWREIERLKCIKEFVKHILFTIVGLAMLILTVHYYSYFLIARQQAKNLQLHQQVNQLDIPLKQLTNSQKKQKIFKKKITKLSQLRHKRYFAQYALAELIHLVPKGVFLSEVEYHRGKMKIRGCAKLSSDIFQFIQVLKQKPYFHQIQLIKIMKDYHYSYFTLEM